ncbi:hypothetical protein LEMLEM_LOCUS1917 [Lemmus lemmus]
MPHLFPRLEYSPTVIREASSNNCREQMQRPTAKQWAELGGPHRKGGGREVLCVRAP